MHVLSLFASFFLVRSTMHTSTHYLSTLPSIQYPHDYQFFHQFSASIFPLHQLHHHSIKHVPVHTLFIHPSIRLVFPWLTLYPSAYSCIKPCSHPSNFLISQLCVILFIHKSLHPSMHFPCSPISLSFIHPCSPSTITYAYISSSIQYSRFYYHSIQALNPLPIWTLIHRLVSPYSVII